MFSLLIFKSKWTFGGVYIRHGLFSETKKGL